MWSAREQAGGSGATAASSRESWESWPASLRTLMDTIRAARAQIVLFWGPDHVALYNDAYAPSIGSKHPAAFGRPAPRMA